MAKSRRNVSRKKRQHKRRNSRRNFRKKLGGGNIDIKKIYDKLIADGFYENISVKVCDENKKDDTITIPDFCESRISGVNKNSVVAGFDLYISPCRIGRKSQYCSKQVINCSIEDNIQKCPLCSILDNNTINPCVALNAKIITPLQSIFLLVPNAYPYLDNQFLITTKSHFKQMDVINDNIDILFQIFLNLLTTDKDVIFFNGICGNSLEHFHCQYTTSVFPIFTSLTKENSGFYEFSYFRGYVLNTSNYTDILGLITKIIYSDFTYNFIVRKIDNNTLQFVFFIRRCIIYNIPDLNFGATELSGIIVGSTSEDLGVFTEDNIIEYINQTNSKDNYKIV
jgi:hypothetical protein